MKTSFALVFLLDKKQDCLSMQHRIILPQFITNCSSQFTLVHLSSMAFACKPSKSFLLHLSSSQFFETESLLSSFYCLFVFLSYCLFVLLSFCLPVIVSFCLSSTQFTLVYWKSSWCHLMLAEIIQRLLYGRIGWVGWDGHHWSKQLSGGVHKQK